VTDHSNSLHPAAIATDSSINQPIMSEVPLQPPSRSLRGRVAIVTGAGCAGDGLGNGRAISILLADDGCNVICLDMNLDWATKTAEVANSKPGRGAAIAAQGDVTVAADCEAVVQLALDKFGRLDILVNNVGTAGAPGTAVDVDMEKWAKGLEVNVSSMVLMTKHAVPTMARNEGEIKGSIINMGSVAGLRGGTPHLLYPTSKGAVVNMTRAMAAHHAKDGIRVNCVCPGVCTASHWHCTAANTWCAVDALHAHDVRRWHD
jgi:NAD(P)-dependent dehydrogenase (short-subunit alcohol dehydrogenase family)